MLEYLQMLYLWLKAAHIIFVIFWMAGLFMMPRQLVYMHAAVPGSAEERLWVDRIRTLGRMILGPSIIAVWVFGLLLAWATGAWMEPWLHLKFLIVLALSAYHGWMTGVARKMAQGARPLSEKTLRIVNEAPAIAAVLIVILVVVRPFS